jgi:hypothetical protein
MGKLVQEKIETARPLMEKRRTSPQATESSKAKTRPSQFGSSREGKSAGNTLPHDRRRPSFYLQRDSRGSGI